MVQPYNYSIQAPSAFEQLVSGLKLGASVQEMQAAAQQRQMQMEQLRAQQEQQARQRQLMDDVIGGKANRGTWLEIGMMGSSEAQRKGAWDQVANMDQQAVRSQIGFGSQLAFALKKNPAVAKQMLEDALRANPNDEFLKRINQLSETDTDFAAQTALLALPGLGKDGLDAYKETVNRLFPEAAKTQDTAPKPERVSLGDRVAIIDQNPNSPTFNQELKSLPMGDGPDKAALGNEFNQLLNERDRLVAAGQANTERFNFVQQRLNRLSGEEKGVTVEVQVPVWNPATQQMEFASRERISQGGLQPPSARPEPPTLNEQQASTATRRLLQRATEISDVVSRNKSAEAPGVGEALVENIPFISRATNLVRSQDRQVVASAQADVLDALLYLATGAAYNKEQLEQQKLAYLPSWSDASEVRALKRQRLIQMIGNAKVRAGKAWSPELDVAMQKLLESPAMRPAGQLAETPAAPSAGFPTPPQAAIDALRAGRGTAAQFDEVFGPGAAARVMGR